MSTRYVIATSKVWDKNQIENVSKSINAEFVHITEKEKLNYNFLMELKPRYIFFPHWSHIIQQDIYENFECVIFSYDRLPLRQQCH